jgi:hypothetical protein
VKQPVVTEPESSRKTEQAEAEVRRVIGAGETASVEFKSSLRYDYQTNVVNKELTKVVAKTVAGFLNAGGGRLLLGVADDFTVLGIERDIQTLSTKNLDGFERTLRNAMALHLGVEVTPHLTVEFIELEGKTLAQVTCPVHHAPVFFRDGERQEFYVRDGNQTRPLDVRASHEYIRARSAPDLSVPATHIRDLVRDSLSEHLRPVVRDLSAALDQVTQRAAPSEVALPPRTGTERVPAWITIATRRVLDLFLTPLALSPGWKRLFLISPWLSEIEHSASLTSNQLLKRLRDEETTVYVVTRPPVEEWHRLALQRLAESGRANIATVQGLHIKLFTAVTSRGSFAMLGSANFTQQALANREIGLLITSFGDGRRLVAELHHEAANIYRLPDRRLVHQASFRRS